MRIVSVVGARPQFVKLAAIASAAARHPGIEHTIVHTGQHYDPQMSDSFFDDLSIPAPDRNLSIGSGSHGVQTAEMLRALEGAFVELEPDWTLVYGDTNSTLAATLAAVKMHLPVAHVEAGLRSFNRRMPEEHNRVLTDHAADLLFAPTREAVGHLLREGLEGRTILVGDVMTDICLRVAKRVADRELPPSFLDLKTQGYVIATVHRAENTDDPERLRHIRDQLASFPVTVVLLAHPRLRARAREFDIQLDRGAVRVLDPLSYPDLVRAVLGAQTVLTDSGGLQKEAFLLARTCTTLRTETEWPETLVDGWNVLDPTAGLRPEVVLRDVPADRDGTVYGDGRAADRIVESLQGWARYGSPL